MQRSREQGLSFDDIFCEHFVLNEAHADCSGGGTGILGLIQLYFHVEFVRVVVLLGLAEGY